MDIEVHYSNGTFLVHNTNHALRLRRDHHILSQPAYGHVPAAGPHCLDPHAVHVVCLNRLATFKQLKLRQNLSTEENKSRYEMRMLQLIDREKELFIARRLDELRRHDVRTPPERNIKEFNERRMRIPVESMPDRELSVYESATLTQGEVNKLLSEMIDENLNLVYLDLYKRGFYLSSGMKFGCDFLAYLGDPVRYHAEYAIRLVPGIADGLVDLNKISFHEINSFQRLTHTANKTPVFATVTRLTTKDEQLAVKYWTLRERVYLKPESKPDELESIDPCVGRHPRPSHVEINNKLRRTS